MPPSRSRGSRPIVLSVPGFRPRYKYPTSFLEKPDNAAADRRQLTLGHLWPVHFTQNGIPGRNYFLFFEDIFFIHVSSLLSVLENMFKKTHVVLKK